MKVLFVIVVILFEICVAVPAELSLPSIDWPAPINPYEDPGSLTRSQLIAANYLAVQAVNNRSDILPNTILSLDIVNVALSPSQALDSLIAFSENGEPFVLGPPSSASAIQTAIVSSVLDVTQLSSLATDPNLTQYPKFNRLIPPSNEPQQVTKDAILYYSEIEDGWTNVAVISTLDGFGIPAGLTFINIAPPEIDVISYRQYLPAINDTTDLVSELEEVKGSGARVILLYAFDDWSNVITSADSVGLVGDDYVLVVPSTVVGLQFEPQLRELSRGILGVIQQFPVTDELLHFNEIFGSLDPAEFPGSEFPPSPFVYLTYDAVITASMAAHSLVEQGKYDNGAIPSPDDWLAAIRNLSFVGASGNITFDENGDRPSVFNVLYYFPETNSWNPAAFWSAASGFELVDDFIWHSNTTVVPDLDIRDPFDYYSCHRKDIFTDETGKTVTLHSPDGSDIDDIDSTYYCDGFIDCKNISDEGFDCNSNYIILFIIFGTLTGILILICLVLIIIVCVYGVILQYRRFRVASPFFLILILLSMIVGYSSIFAWFGKPHPVACVFQLWLLGLPVLSMITALTVKTFRIWRIFRFPMKKTKISNFELLALWSLVMIPALFIVVLWTIVSTPTAKLEERNGEDHYVCTTGGFTGTPGGIIFFSIFTAYGALVLLFGALVTILVRRVPSQFNESKLLGISIYNLAFLSVVIIPVYLIVIVFDPYIAWILRTVAVLYAFTAPMVLQFLPILIGIFIIDKGKNVKVFKTKLSNTSGYIRDKDEITTNQSHTPSQSQ